MTHILRRLKRSPMFTATTILTLAVGIGANTAVFSVVHGVLLKPLAFRDPDRLVSIWQTAPGLSIPRLNASPATYYTYREENRTLQDIGVWTRNSVTVTGIAEPEEVLSLVVTDGVLPVLGAQPAIGRWFSQKDDTPGTPETAILSYGYWQRRFGGSPSALGRTVVVDGRAREIIGVLPRQFHFMNLQPSLVFPIKFNRSDVFVGNFSYQAVARLKPGVTIAQANADVARMLPMLPDKFRFLTGMNRKMWEEARLGPEVKPLKDDVTGEAGKLIWVLMGTVGIVLFIACANVANLLLVRADGRRLELAIRAALGAGWSRIARELLLESLALGAAGGVLGLGLAYAAVRALVAAAPVGLPRIDELALDATVIFFAVTVSLVSGLVFGMIPVFKYAGPQLVAGVREAGRTIGAGRERHRARSTLVVVQVALALVLLVGSGLMIRTFAAMRKVEPGFQRPQEILTLRLSIPRAQVPESEKVVRMQQAILDKISGMSGVQSAAIASEVPMDGNQRLDPIYVEGRAYAESQFPPVRRYKSIGPGFFHTIGNPLRAGRELSWTDIYELRPVVLVSENFAREYWGDPAAAIGKRIRENSNGIWREIIGVAGNDRHDGVEKPPPSTIYWPILLKGVFGQQNVVARRMVTYAIRSPRTGTVDFLKDVQQAIWSINPNLPLADVRTLQDLYERSMARTSFALSILGIAAGMALLLGIVGIYGVISYSVSQRTREIGIRMALGAEQSDVRGMFVRHGLVLTGIGVAFGLAASFALMRWMTGLLFEVRTIDPVTYGAVAVVLLAAAVSASYLPARRATTIEPVEALRGE